MLRGGKLAPCSGIKLESPGRFMGPFNGLVRKWVLLVIAYPIKPDVRGTFGGGRLTRLVKFKIR